MLSIVSISNLIRTIISENCVEVIEGANKLEIGINVYYHTH